MIYEIKIPQEDLNSEFAVIEKWNVSSGDYIKKGDIICGIETTKATFEIESPKTGYIKTLKNDGYESSFDEVIAVIGDSEEEISRYKEAVPVSEDAKYNVTRKAASLIEHYKIDITKIPTLIENMITEKDVKEYINSTGNKLKEFIPSSSGVLPPKMKRVGLIGAGLGLTQVVDILKNYHDVSIAQVYDDDKSLWGGKIVHGLQISGGINKCLEDFEKDEITHAIITVSSISARKLLYEKITNKGLPLLNAIDKSCQIKSDVVIGEGNVICSNVHIGTGTVIGDNNFINAFNSFDHHNVLGSHITAGPGVMTSGLVVIEDEVKFGTGIFVEPHIKIGQKSIIASGVILTRNIPPLHIVKPFIKNKIEEIR